MFVNYSLYFSINLTNVRHIAIITINLIYNILFNDDLDRQSLSALVNNLIYKD